MTAVLRTLEPTRLANVFDRLGDLKVFDDDGDEQIVDNQGAEDKPRDHEQRREELPDRCRLRRHCRKEHRGPRVAREQLEDREHRGLESPKVGASEVVHELPKNVPPRHREAERDDQDEEAQVEDRAHARDSREEERLERREVAHEPIQPQRRDQEQQRTLGDQADDARHDHGEFELVELALPEVTHAVGRQKPQDRLHQKDHVAGDVGVLGVLLPGLGRRVREDRQRHEVVEPRAENEGLRRSSHRLVAVFLSFAGAPSLNLRRGLRCDLILHFLTPERGAVLLTHALERPGDHRHEETQEQEGAQTRNAEVEEPGQRDCHGLAFERLPQDVVVAVGGNNLSQREHGPADVIEMLQLIPRVFEFLAHLRDREIRPVLLRSLIPIQLAVVIPPVWVHGVLAIILAF
eukprot:3941507-Rhodomonas_salina.3